VRAEDEFRGEAGANVGFDRKTNTADGFEDRRFPRGLIAANHDLRKVNNLADAERPELVNCVKQFFLSQVQRAQRCYRCVDLGFTHVEEEY